VCYDYAGWVTYEPTPSGALQSALDAASGDPSSGLAAWLEELMRNLRRWLESGDESWLGTLWSTLLDLPAALLQTLKRHPVPFLSLLVPVAWLLVRRVRRRQGARRGANPPPAAAPDRDGVADELHRRLLRLLARLGFHPQPPQTPREFANHVHRRGGTAFAPLLPLTDTLYRARYGGIEPDSAEMREADAFLEALEEWQGVGAKREE